MLSFTSTDMVLNLSSMKLTEEELGIIKHGLKHPTESEFNNKTDVLTTFGLIHRAMIKDLKGNRDAGAVNVSSYKPTLYEF